MASANARVEELERRLIVNRRLMLGLYVLVLVLIALIAYNNNRGDLTVERLRVVDDRGEVVVYLKAAKDGIGVVQVFGPKQRTLIYPEVTQIQNR